MGLFLQLLARGLVTGSWYALLGASWGIIYNTTKTFHFAHGFIYTLAAYVLVLLAGRSVGLAPSLLAALAAAVLAGCAIEFFAYQPMRRKGASQLSVFLTAMGIMIAGTSLTHLLFGPDSRPLKAVAEEIYIMGPVVMTSTDLITMGTAWICIAALFLFLSHTHAGMMIRAVSSNPEKATFIGIDSRKVFVLVFGIGSLLMGLAAFLGTLDKPANPQVGLEALLISFITVFLGGVGSLGGAVLGGVILGLADSLVLLVLPTEYKTVVIFAILFAVILFRPEGLMGESRSR